MSEFPYKYSNLIERQQQVKKAEALGYVMRHDHFDADWKKGDEPHGTMTFTDEPPEAEVVISPPARDLAAEIDELKDRVKKLEYPST